MASSRRETDDEFLRFQKELEALDAANGTQETTSSHPPRVQKSLQRLPSLFVSLHQPPLAPRALPAFLLHWCVVHRKSISMPSSSASVPPSSFASHSGGHAAPGPMRSDGKGKNDKKFVRAAAGEVWEDPTLAEWPENDFRMFIGDLGNDATDQMLASMFTKYPSFVKAKVVRDKRTMKPKGFGFASFTDPLDYDRAFREQNGKYCGGRPMKIRKSTWKDRSMAVKRKRLPYLM